MAGESQIYCGGTAPASQGKDDVVLDLGSAREDVNVVIEGLDALPSLSDVDRLTDLVEIAAYIYGADQLVLRPTSDGRGIYRGRNFELHIPVRDQSFWTNRSTITKLAQTLESLTGDRFTFDFHQAKQPASPASYLDPGSAPPSGFAPAAAALFSGGIDSLAGAVDTVTGRNQSAVLVSQRPTLATDRRQAALVEELVQRTPEDAVHHVSFFVSPPSHLQHRRGTRTEPSRTTAGFVRAALAFVAARVYGISEVEIPVNGVAAFNLPLSERDAVDNRPLGPAHPAFLARLKELFGAIANAPFTVENPLIWRTKAEVVNTLAQHNCADLIELTTSCEKGGRPIAHPQCGSCVHCLDRRAAVVKTGLEAQDQPGRYELVVFTGARPPGRKRMVAETYVRTWTEIRTASEEVFFERYPMCDEWIPILGPNHRQSADQLLGVHRRHAVDVQAAIGKELTRTKATSLPESCLLRLAVHIGGPAAPVTTRRLMLIVEQDGAVFEGIRVWERKSSHLPILRFLADRWLEDKAAGAPPDEYQRFSAEKLTKRLSEEGILHRDDAETVRKAVGRLRSKLMEVYEREYGVALEAEEIIRGSTQDRGYGINPNRIEVAIR